MRNLFVSQEQKEIRRFVSELLERDKEAIEHLTCIGFEILHTNLKTRRKLILDVLASDSLEDAKQIVQSFLN